MTRPLTPENTIFNRLRWSWQDGLLILSIIALLFVIMRTASHFTGAYHADIEIETDPRYLPSYTLQTLLRMAIAYLLSLAFSLIYAYTAYRSKIAAQILLPLLDILQSIPVLSFLPGVVLALVALFPGERLGVELAAIILIFTGMTWNMVFSFYQSLTSIPQELLEAASVYRLNFWQRFWTLELPSGVIGLVWNSVMSVAGGWFFLIAIESFTLGDQSFKLPGLGSFLARAANEGNFGSIVWGLAVLIAVIVIIDFLIWRPAIAWAEKFKYETIETQNEPVSAVLEFLRRSPTLRLISERFLSPAARSLDDQFARFRASSGTTNHKKSQGKLGRWLNRAFVGSFTFIVLWGTWEAVLLLQKLNFEDWKTVMIGAIFTASRVMVALLLSLLWTVPVGVAIGRDPKLAQILQPLVQIAASVPATALFPVLLLFLARLGGGLQIGSIALMMLGTMWYILFNVIAGAQSIPSELFEAAKVYRLSLVQRWRTLIYLEFFPI
jgi:NitT/TauT family transport system permease protein